MILANIGFNLNTFVIRLTKWFLLGCGVLTVSSIFAWPYVGGFVGDDGRIKVTISENLGTKTALTAVNTQFLGRDSQQRLVEINAKQATPTDKEFSNVGLDKPTAAIALENGESLAVESSDGTYDRENNQLVLKGDVKLTSTDGYDIQTQEAKVSLETNYIETDKHVVGFGPTGTLEAEGMQVDQANGKIILKGKSKLVFDVKAINEQKQNNSTNE